MTIEKIFNSMNLELFNYCYNKLLHFRIIVNGNKSQKDRKQQWGDFA